MVVANETAARRFWGGNAVGQRIRPQDAPDGWREVIGVVADVKVSDVTEPPTPSFYYSTEQVPSVGFTVVARTSGDPAALTGALKGALQEVRASLPVTNSAISRKCPLQGVISDHVLQMPMTGRPSNMSSG